VTGVIAEPSTRVRPSASGAVLAETKVRIPRGRSHFVSRGRLVERLALGGDARLVLVQAPLGFGKTTLLAGWHEAEAEDRPFAWLSLDRSDNDPVRFVEGVIAALRVVDRRIGGEALVRLEGGASLTGVVLPLLLNDLGRLPRRLVLVLDDYHVIESPRAHAAVTYLLDHQPPTLQLAMATRSRPPLPLGRLRVRRELLEVRAGDLRFTDEEAAALLEAAGDLGLEPSDVARLQDRTEGWAAGLQLAALSLSGRPRPREFIASFAGDDRPVVDYLAFEVLDGQPPEVREFLLSTSVLDRLCGSLCDRLTGGEGSARRLQALERAGLMIMPLDDTGDWYRYHHLFAELLRHELKRTRPGRVAALHRRASAWYRDAGSVDEAVQHAIAGGDLAAATELITEQWYGFLQRGRIETVAGWLDALGEGVVGGEPALCLTKAWIAVNTGRLDQVGRWIEAAERAGADETTLRSGVASLHEIHEYMSGDVERAVQAGRRSVEEGDTPWRPVGCPVLGLALFWSGLAAEAGAELESSVETARAADNHLAVIHASAGVAAIRAQAGDLRAADATACAALSLA
jgi:LuxR family maltose regulon positive regulatory protein